MLHRRLPACLGAKYITLGRWPGSSLVRRQVLQPWLPLLSKLVLSATSTGENWPSSFPSSAGARLCVPTRGQVGTVMPQLVAHRCSALGWELLSGWEFPMLGSLAEILAAQPQPLLFP